MDVGRMFSARVALVLVTYFSLSMSAEVTVTTSNGIITGFIKNVIFSGEVSQVKQFLGIPFAERMSAATRFRRAQPLTEQFENYNATFHRPLCPQNVKLNPSLWMFSVSEDCLYLNVYAPFVSQGGVTKKAVMVWLYGGSFSFGGADYYSGEILSGFHDVVVVTFNYRMALFGFLSSGDKILPGNLGLWDQHLALKWVHENIAAFGGDPERVTLFGESAGAASILYQATFPPNKGLFKRVISQSGSSLAPWALQRKPKETFDTVASKTDCVKDNTEETVECLRGKTVEELTSIMTQFETYGPVIDGDFVKEDPALTLEGSSPGSNQSRHQFRELDFLSGVNSKDGGMIIRYVSQMGQNLSQGLPNYIFKDMMLPIAIRLAGLEYTPVLKNAALHQYTNWKNPSDLISVRDNMIDFSSDVSFFVPAIRSARAHADPSSLGSTYMFVFSLRFSFSQSPAWLQGATHTEEIPFVLGFPNSLKAAVNIPPETPIPFPQVELDLSREVMSYWTNFAKTGNPNGNGLVDWPQFTRDEEKYMDLNFVSSVKARLAAPRVAFWVNLVPSITSCSSQKDCQECSNNPNTGTSLTMNALMVAFLCSLCAFLSSMLCS